MTKDRPRPNDIVIIGAGGLAREVTWLIEEINHRSLDWNLLGFIEMEPEPVGDPCGKWQIIGDDVFVERDLRRTALSFDGRKRIPIGRGGMVLTDADDAGDMEFECLDLSEIEVYGACRD